VTLAPSLPLRQHALAPTSRGIDVTQAEALIRDMSAIPPGWSTPVIDLSACQYIHSGVGWRLANALSLFSHGSQVDVVVPMDPTTSGYSGPWFRNFTRTGLGMAIAHYARDVYAGDRNIAEELRSYYAGYLYEHAIQLSPNSLTVVGLDRAHVNMNKKRAFIEQFQRWVWPVSHALRALNRDVFLHLASICFEAIENVRDHAFKHTEPPQRPGLSYFALRYHSKGLPERGAPGNTRRYVERVERRAGFSVRGFIEVVINDAGIGIPARHSQDMKIYTEDPKVEAEVIIDALKPSTSIKHVVPDTHLDGEVKDVGYGYPLMHVALKSLHAHAVLRTGRHLAVFDSTTYGAKSLVLDSQVYGYLPGTTLEILFPVPSLQNRLPGM
jgi:hypothetical protein